MSCADGNGVEDEVEAGGGGLHLVLVGRDDDVVRAKLACVVALSTEWW